jgi:hypothetical protein
MSVYTSDKTIFYGNLTKNTGFYRRIKAFAGEKFFQIIAFLIKIVYNTKATNERRLRE